MVKDQITLLNEINLGIQGLREDFKELAEKIEGISINLDEFEEKQKKRDKMQMASAFIPFF